MYCVNSSLPTRHVKYVYDCVNPTFAKEAITLGRVNASDKKIMSGYSLLISRIVHSQKAMGFVCGLSTLKIFTPCSIQKVMTDFNSFHRANQFSFSKLNG